jgi:hypothetical protein
MLMPLRVAVEMPPAWEILLALALTAGFVWLMILLCGRIYRGFNARAQPLLTLLDDFKQQVQLAYGN